MFARNRTVEFAWKSSLYGWFVGYDLPHRHYSSYIGKEAHCYSHERDTASTPHFVRPILQHSLPAFEFAGSSALDQVRLMNLDPLRHLNGRAMKICMI